MVFGDKVTDIYSQKECNRAFFMVKKVKTFAGKTVYVHGEAGFCTSCQSCQGEEGRVFLERLKEEVL